MTFRLVITVDWNRNQQREAAGVAPALTRRGLILSADGTPVASKWYHRYGNSPLSEAACYREPETLFELRI